MTRLAGKYFPLADPPTSDDLVALLVRDKVGIWAMATGEIRSQRKGECYLSGAIVEAYRAPGLTIYLSDKSGRLLTFRGQFNFAVDSF